MSFWKHVPNKDKPTIKQNGNIPTKNSKVCHDSLSQRIGNFSVSFAVWDKDLPSVAETLSHLKFIPITAQTDGIGQLIVFQGYSPEFEEIQIGAVIPTYRLAITSDATGIIEVKAIRV